MHIQPEPEDFGGYADLYAGHKDEDIQGDINPSTSYVHLSPTPLLVDGSEDIKVLFDVYEDIKHDLIESKNLNLSRYCHFFQMVSFSFYYQSINSFFMVFKVIICDL